MLYSIFCLNNHIPNVLRLFKYTNEFFRLLLAFIKIISLDVIESSHIIVPISGCVLLVMMKQSRWRAKKQGASASAGSPSRLCPGRLKSRGAQNLINGIKLSLIGF